MVTSIKMFHSRDPFAASFSWQLNASSDLKWMSCFLSFLLSFIFSKELPRCFTRCVREWKRCVPQTCQESSYRQKVFDILAAKWLHLQSCLAGRRPVVCHHLLHLQQSGYAFCSARVEFRTVFLRKYCHKKRELPSATCKECSSFPFMILLGKREILRPVWWPDAAAPLASQGSKELCRADNMSNDW